MTEEKFTQAPWMLTGYDDDGGYFVLERIEGNGGLTAVAWPKRPDDCMVMVTPDEHLLRASPNLYNVLAQALDVFSSSPIACTGEHCDCAECQTLEDMRAALAEARGEVVA